MLENIEVFGEDLGENNNTVFQNIFDILHPINEVIIQYPNQKSPMELFNNDQVVSVWEQQLQYNSAFFRSDKPPTELWSPDEGSHFYRQANKNNPVNIGSISKSRTGTTQYNEEEELTYTKWVIVSSGKGNNFNSGMQTNQNKYHDHSNTVSITQQPQFYIANDNSTYQVDFLVESRGGPSWESGVINITADGIGTVDSGRGANANTMWTNGDHSWRRSKYTCVHRHIVDSQNSTSATISYSNIPTGNTNDEARPDNYTVKIWKRIS